MQTASESYTLTHDGTTYTWDGRGWFRAGSYQRPPSAIAAKLNREIQQRLADRDDAVEGCQALIDLAKIARLANHFERAEKAVRRALAESPGHEGGLAVLCSILRDRKRPEDAVRETEAAVKSSYPPLLTTRAAALCDLERWEEAKATIARALAAGKSNEAAFAVVNRIKAARPELYGG